MMYAGSLGLPTRRQKRSDCDGGARSEGTISDNTICSTRSKLTIRHISNVSGTHITPLALLPRLLAFDQHRLAPYRIDGCVLHSDKSPRTQTRGVDDHVDLQVAAAIVGCQAQSLGDISGKREIVTFIQSGHLSSQADHAFALEPSSEVLDVPRSVNDVTLEGDRMGIVLLGKRKRQRGEVFVLLQDSARGVTGSNFGGGGKESSEAVDIQSRGVGTVHVHCHSPRVPDPWAMDPPSPWFPRHLRLLGRSRRRKNRPSHRDLVLPWRAARDAGKYAGRSPDHEGSGQWAARRQRSTSWH